jgi:hypothetical protein
MNTRNQFVGHLMNMPFARLVEYIYWDNHGGDNMDIEPSDWTMAMVIEVINGDEWQSFSTNYARFLEATA